jgi:hypothetical protein
MSEPVKESWLQWVALATTILAVAAAISSLKASSYSTRVQVHTTEEANQWAYFQAKSIKEHGFRLNKDVLTAVGLMEIQNHKMRDFLSAKEKEYNVEIARYEQERQQIKADAEIIVKEQTLFKRHNENFALAVMLLQIAIMLSAVGALIKKKSAWFAGIAIGAVGLIYMVNGFFLIF